MCARAQNEMVKCLRRFKCNPHLDGLVQLKYDALKGVNVPSCGQFLFWLFLDMSV